MRPEGIMLKKISNDTMGNRTRDLPACRAVPQTDTVFKVRWVHELKWRLCGKVVW